MSDAQNLILGPLNPEQRAAVETIEGPVLILAGAGSGKTRALTHRIAYLIERGVPPWQILAVTFTNKAAAEMKQRILHLLKLTNEGAQDGGAIPMIGTFHSICVRMLRRDIEHIGGNRNFVIYDSDDQEKMMKLVLEEMRVPVEEIKPRAALGHISRAKSEAIRPKEFLNQATTPLFIKIAEAYALYQKKLRECNALDFDDLILEVVRLLEECPDVLARYQNTWKFLHVDEYQDTNHAQYLMVSLLARAHRNLCVIGDPDQSIYAFRGADIRNILEYQNEHHDATCIKLEQNYRSTQLVLDAADAVIAVNPNRPPKKMWTEKKEGPALLLREVENEKEEAQAAVDRVLQFQKKSIPLSDQVILYRTNAQSRLFEESCLRHGVPYRIVGGVKFYARREVKDVLAYLMLLVNPQDTISLLRVINVPSRKIGQTTLVKLQAYANERKMNLWQTLAHIGMIEGLNEPTKERIASFVSLIEQFTKRKETETVSVITQALLEQTNMQRWIRDDTEEGESRWENVQELLNVTKKYDHLAPDVSLVSFLEEVALISEVDKLNDGQNDALTLMTVHLCKGLEFRSVTIVGCEEGLFPIGAALIDRGQLEEERRLMYVAMTRSKEHLALLHARSRMQWGSVQSNPRSRFLDDIPHTVVEAQSDELLSAFGFGSGRTKSHLQPYRQHHTGSPADFDFNQDPPDIEEGTRISHPHFGAGIVLGRQGDIAEVRFDSGQTKRLALNIAPVTVLS